jgi:hypothetical protein
MNAFFGSGILMIGLMLGGSAAAGPASSLWQEVQSKDMVTQGERTSALPKHYRVLRLNAAAFEQQTSQVPQPSTLTVQSSPAVVELPLPGGGYREFRIVQSEVMPKALADQYPEIHSYAGEAVGDSSVKLRLDWSPSGLHAMVTTPKGVVLIEPYAQRGGDLYLNFYQHDAKRLQREHEGPDFIDKPEGQGQWDTLKLPAAEPSSRSTGDKLRIYKVAVAASSSYSQYFGLDEKEVMASIVRAINRVNGIYQQELSVKFELVEENKKILFLNQKTDPYYGLINRPLLEKNQKVLDEKIGSKNYHLGHVFIIAEDGLAMSPSVCDPESKAKGYTGAKQPAGDAFWVDYVAHEMGHQLGASHTFNSPLGSCGGINRAVDSAYEIGSGVTIMGYAGICGADNIQKNSIPYFHVRSFDQIAENVWSGEGSSCGDVTNTGNAPPTVDAGASGAQIPKQTPFFLKGQGNDVDGDRLTYSWEEYDLGQEAATVKTTEAQEEGLGIVPLFRSFAPKQGDVRVFPQVASILSGELKTGEVLPGYSRTLSFRLVARDGKGGVAASSVRTINVVGGAGPFVITKPAQTDTWSVYTGTAKVQWDVAHTDEVPISCNTVNIALSLDDGKSFTGLAMGVANSGEKEVTVPNTPSNKARVRVLCPGKFFASISPKFSIKE